MFNTEVCNRLLLILPSYLTDGAHCPSYLGHLIHEHRLCVHHALDDTQVLHHSLWSGHSHVHQDHDNHTGEQGRCEVCAQGWDVFLQKLFKDKKKLPNKDSTERKLKTLPNKSCSYQQNKIF